MTNTSGHELTPEGVRGAIREIRALVDVHRKELRAMECESIDKIKEIQKKCPHANVIYSCGTPYDRGYHECTDCGSEVKNWARRPQLPTGNTVYKALLARSEQIKRGEG